jgi:hypothetical protein
MQQKLENIGPPTGKQIDQKHCQQPVQIEKIWDKNATLGVMSLRN